MYSTLVFSPPRLDIVYLRTALLGLLVALFFGCDSGSTPPPEQVSPAIFDQGASWTYDISFTQSLLDETAVDTLGATTARMEVANTDAQLSGRSGLVVLEVYSPSAPDSIDLTWYDQSPDSLVEVAHSGPSRVARPFRRGKAESSVQARRLTRGISGLPMLVRWRLASTPVPQRKALRKRVTGDSVQVRDDSRVVLKAPLTEGRSWVSFRTPILSERTVVGRSTVETTAGTFRTVEVVNTLPGVAPSLRWRDYYTEDGLVHRVVTDTVQVRGPDGTMEGHAVSRESYDLVSHED